MSRTLKYFALFVLLLSASISFGCPGERFILHKNPDGSIGGKVSVRANLSPGTFVEKNAMVCGSAKIGNSKILGRSIVKENSWIKDYVEISGNAIVSGSVYISGLAALRVKIHGNAKVGGAARVLEGSEIEGNSVVFGRPTIVNSKVSGSSIVCDSFVIKSENIEDSKYFCGDLIANSRSKLIRESRTSFLPMGKNIRLNLDKDNFSTSGNYLSLMVNGKSLSSSDYIVQGPSLTIHWSDNFHEGLNSIVLSARDSFGKVINDSIDLYIGEESISFFIGNKLFDMEFKFQNEQMPEARFIKKGKFLVLENIPQSFMNYPVDLRVISDIGFVDFNGTLTELRDKELIQPHLTETNMNFNFENGLEGWKTSTQEMSMYNEGSSRLLVISPDLQERMFTIISTVMSTKPVQLNYRIADNSKYPDETVDIKIDVVDLETGEVYKSPVSSGSESYFSKVLSANKRYSIRFHGDFPNITTHKTYIFSLPEQARFTTPLKLELKNPFFFLKSEIKNVADPSDINFSCNNAAFEVAPLFSTSSITTDFTYNSGEENQWTAHSIKDDLRYLSVGSDPFYTTNIMNRLYANIYLNSIDVKDLDWLNAKLVILNPENQTKVEAKISPCVAKKILSINLPAAPELKVWDTVPHRGSYAFYLTESEMLSLANVSKGVRITLAVPGKRSPALFKSNPIYLPVLKNLNFTSSTPPGERTDKYTYGDLETYVNGVRENVLTNGDKWIFQNLSPVLERIWNKTNPKEPSHRQWLFGDASRMNGGRFPVHVTHSDGRDMDISFSPENNKKPYELKNGSKASQYVREIKRFLEAAVDEYKYLLRVLITAPSGSKQFKAFQNSCISDKRIIRLNSLIPGSLLSHVKSGHTDHLHLQFKTIREVENYVPKPSPSTFDLSIEDFEFSFLDDGSFVVTNLRGNIDSGVIAWRLQDSINNEDVGNLSYGYDEIQEESLGTEISRDRWLKLSILNEDGGCVEFDWDLKFNLDKVCRDETNKILPFRFHPDGLGKVALTASAVNSTLDSLTYVCDEAKLTNVISRNSRFTKKAVVFNANIKDSEINDEIKINEEGRQQSIRSKIENSILYGDAKLVGNQYEGISLNQAILDVSGEVSGALVVGGSNENQKSFVRGTFDVSGIVIISESKINEKSSREEIIKYFPNESSPAFQNLQIENNSVVEGSLNASGEILLNNVHINGPLTIYSPESRFYSIDFFGASITGSGRNLILSSFGQAKRIENLNIVNNSESSFIYPLSIERPSDMINTSIYITGFNNVILRDPVFGSNVQLNAILGEVLSTCHTYYSGEIVHGPNVRYESCSN